MQLRLLFIKEVGVRSGAAAGSDTKWLITPHHIIDCSYKLNGTGGMFYLRQYLFHILSEHATVF